MSLPELEEFLSWFQSNGGRIDLDAVGFKYFPSTEGGRGAVALKNIEVRQCPALFRKIGLSNCVERPNIIHHPSSVDAFDQNIIVT